MYAHRHMFIDEICTCLYLFTRIVHDMYFQWYNKYTHFLHTHPKMSYTGRYGNPWLLHGGVRVCAPGRVFACVRVRVCACICECVRCACVYTCTVWAIFCYVAAAVNKYAAAHTRAHTHAYHTDTHFINTMNCRTLYCGVEWWSKLRNPHIHTHIYLWIFICIHAYIYTRAYLDMHVLKLWHPHIVRMQFVAAQPQMQMQYMPSQPQVYMYELYIHVYVYIWKKRVHVHT